MNLLLDKGKIHNKTIAGDKYNRPLRVFLLNIKPNIIDISNEIFIYIYKQYL